MARAHGKLGCCVALLCVLVAAQLGRAATTPDATQLVLQPGDVPGLTIVAAPQATASDGDLSVSSTKYRRVSGAKSLYSYTQFDGIPIYVTSRAVIFQDATGAHGAFLEVGAKLARQLNSAGGAVAIGQEGWRFNVLVLGEYVLWRQGNVLAELQVYDTTGPAKSAMDYAPLQQNRIAALVPAADPGTPVVVKPVIGKPIAQPVQPRAGRPFTVAFRVTRNDDGTALMSATVVTKTTVAAKDVPHRYSFSAAQLKVSLNVPRTAKGKTLRIMATVRAEGQVTTKSVTYRVR